MKIDLTLDDIQHQRFHSVYYHLIKQLTRSSRLNELDVVNILITYYKFVLTNGRSSRYMTHTQFASFYQIYLKMPDLEWVQSVLIYVDPDSLGFVSPQGFFRLIELYATGSLQEKIKFCFGVYTSGLHDDRHITRPLLFNCCRNMIVCQNQDELDQLAGEYVDFLLRRMDIDRDGRISFEDYSETVAKTPLLLEFLGPVIPDNDMLSIAIGIGRAT